MDTNNGQYGNILSALAGAGMGNSNAGGLSIQERSDNFQIYNELMDKGISIKDLMEKASQVDELKQRLDRLDKAQPSLDKELFTVMEDAVKNDPTVKLAKQRVSSEKTRVISEVCSRDERYTEAYSAYKTAVNAAYIRQKEPSKG